MSEKSTETVPVAIVGGGPVGLTAALELGRRGIRSLLIEQTADINSFPRMLFVNYRSMQHCRRWGIADAVRSRTIYPADYPMDITFTTGLDGFEITRFEYPSHGAVQLPLEVPEASQICPQSIFDRLMLETATATPNTDIRFSHRLESFTQDASGVTLEAVDLDTGRSLSIRAEYLIACDGAASSIRKSLGIEMPGEFHDYNVSVLFKAPDILSKTSIRPARHFHIIGRRGFDGILNSVDGGTTWRMGFGGMSEEPDLATFDALGRIRSKIGIDVDMEIVAALSWTRATRTAERYRDGRVFLAGDSAHTWSPTGGFGMNTGISDAVDITWKLAACLGGWGGPGLLDSYDLERRPVCEAVLAEARQNYLNLRIKADFETVVGANPAGEAGRDELAAKIQSTIRREYETIGVQMSYRYEDSPVIVTDGTAPPSQRSDVYIPTARPGHIAPHAWLPDGRSTLDLFGPSMTLLAFDGADPSGFVDEAHRVNMPLSVEAIDRKDLFDLYEARLVLVRPDGHVAWRSTSAPRDPGTLISHIRGAP